jgi:predicted TIM-barrel fold metal-dependent hydrolase
MRVGMTRAVVVQPAPYGSDPTALLDALGRARGALRGVAVSTSVVSDGTLEKWHEAGVRALRFTEVLDSGTGKPFAGSVGVDELIKLAPRLKALGWHAQIWARCHDIPRIVGSLAGTNLPLVFEHMTSVTLADGVKAPAFQQVLDLVKDCRIWVKVNVCRVSSAMPDYADARPFHDALVGANPSQLLWASDWPFVRLGDLSPDVGRLIDLFHTWVPDEATRHRILVSNPAALYDFDHGASLM